MNVMSFIFSCFSWCLRGKTHVATTTTPVILQAPQPFSNPVSQSALAAIASLQNRVSELEAANRHLNAESAEWRGRGVSLLAENSRLHVHVSELQERATQYQSESNDRASTIVRLTASHNELGQLYERQKVLYDEYENDYQDLESRYESLQSELQVLQSVGSREELVRENRDVLEENESLREQLIEARSENRILFADNIALRDMLQPTGPRRRELIEEKRSQNGQATPPAPSTPPLPTFATSSLRETTSGFMLRSISSNGLVQRHVPRVVPPLEADAPPSSGPLMTARTQV